VPSLLLIIAPRHVERAAEIRATLEKLGLRVVQRSEQWGADREFDCLLLDTTGELRSWYAAATVVFMGKSLTAAGGQNPVEPILAGKPVIFGPHMENFASLAAALRGGGGAIQIADAESLVGAAAELLREPERRTRLVANAEAVLDHHRGATERTAALLLNLQSTASARV
jgi:3-deoxy-D-manno-octulosonic-acid transferase